MYVHICFALCACLQVAVPPGYEYKPLQPYSGKPVKVSLCSVVSERVWHMWEDNRTLLFGTVSTNWGYAESTAQHTYGRYDPSLRKSCVARYRLYVT